MKFIKRLLAVCMVAFMTIGICGCTDNNNESEFSAISYDKPVAVEDIDAYKNEVSKPTGGKNNAPVENGIVLCPYYSLKVNGREIPVYTTRCTNGTHSFAWVDIKGAPENVLLNVELTTTKKYTAVAVLPEKAGVKATLNDKTVKATITDYGDYSFAFATDRLKTFRVNNQPLTLIVAPESSPTVPEGYEYVEIEPGRYGYEDLVLKNSNTFYLFKKGEYEVRRVIASKLENVEIYFEPRLIFPFTKLRISG